MESARVSCPQVDLTRCGLDKTPTLLVLQSRGNPHPQGGEGIRRGCAPLPREELQEVLATAFVNRAFRARDSRRDCTLHFSFIGREEEEEAYSLSGLPPSSLASERRPFLPQAPAPCVLVRCVWGGQVAAVRSRSKSAPKRGQNMFMPETWAKIPSSCNFCVCRFSDTGLRTDPLITTPVNLYSITPTQAYGTPISDINGTVIARET